jgi:hypothetical protein
VKKYIQIIVLALASLVATAGAGPLSAQGPRWAPTQGVIDPTAPTYNGNKPMQCTASTTPTSAFAEQNRATLTQAIADATAQGKLIYLPRCETDAISGLACPMDDSCAYPIQRRNTGGTATQNNCGVDFAGASNVTIYGYGAQLRMFNGGAFDMQMLCIRSASHIRLLGLHLSERDNTSTSEQTHMVEFGDAGAGGGSVDDVELLDMVFHEAKPGDTNHHGDCVILNGAAGFENKRISIMHSQFHECNRTGIAHQKGHVFDNIIENTFDGTRNSDIDNEPTSTSDNKYESIIGNHFDHTGGSSAISVSGLYPTRRRSAWSWPRTRSWEPASRAYASSSQSSRTTSSW